MLLEIVSPESVLFNGEVESVLVPGVQGSFEILKDHAPIVSILSKGIVVIKGNVRIALENKSYFSENTPKQTLLKIKSGTLETTETKSPW